MLDFTAKIENVPCNYLENRTDVAPGKEPELTAKAAAAEGEKILLAYAPKVGLVKTGPNGSIKESDILRRLILLPDKTLGDRKKFFREFGFLFPVSDEEYFEMDLNILFGILERLKITVFLRSELGSGKKNYDKILADTLMLIFSPDIFFSTDDLFYYSCHHHFIDCLKSASFDPLEYIESEPEYIESEGPYDFELNEEPLEKDEDGESIPSYSDVYYNHQESHQLFEDEIYNYVIALYYDNFYRHPLENVLDQKFSEVMYNYFKDAGEIPFSDILSGNIPKIKDLTPEMKRSLVEIAKFVLGEEINANIREIHPMYDYEKMTASWKLDSLLSAAYFSVYFLGEDQIYRTCACCGEPFMVTVTATNRKYCSPECCNRASVARYRARLKENMN